MLIKSTISRIRLEKGELEPDTVEIINSPKGSTLDLAAKILYEDMKQKGVI